MFYSHQLAEEFVLDRLLYSSTHMTVLLTAVLPSPQSFYIYNNENTTWTCTISAVVFKVYAAVFYGS